MKRDQVRNIQIPYLEMDKYHCTQNPATKLRFTTCNLFVYLPLCYLPRYLENCVYFHIVFFALSG